MLEAAHRRVVTIVVSAVLAIALGVTGLFLHVPYVELSPNETCNVLASCDYGGGPVQVLEIDDKVKQYPTDGHLNLTTVAVRGGPGSPINLLTALRGWFDDSLAVVPEELVYPPGQTQGEVECENTAQQLQSQSSATTAALRHLDYKVKVTKQVYVAGFSATGQAQEAGLGECDVILAVDGDKVTSQDQLTKLVGKHEVGEVVKVRYRDDKKTRTANVRLTADPQDKNKPLIGIRPQERELSKPPFDVTINLQEVGGPSAGLMFALGIIDKLTPGELAGGEFVAGTGEISDNGTVGPIGGIQQKLIGARRDGATVFLVPTANCADAVGSAPDGLRLASVGTLDDALDALATLRAEPGTFTECKG